MADHLGMRCQRTLGAEFKRDQGRRCRYHREWNVDAVAVRMRGTKPAPAPATE
jgi:hypothetical protein